MALVGSIMLIAGAAGLILFLTVMTLKRSLLSHRATSTILILWLIIAAAGLLMVTIASGGRSLHTGGFWRFYSKL